VAYIGVQPAAGQYRKLDDISASFNGTTATFTTSVSGENVTAGTAQQLLVSVGGVIQEPKTDYDVSTNSITFTTAPAAGLDFFAVLMGDAVNTITVPDGSVTTAKLAGSLSVGLAGGSNSAPTLFFTGDTNTGVYSPAADQVAVTTNGVERVEWGTSEVVFNDGGNNYDFRVEGDTNANLFFVDASADAVGIGTTSPSRLLHLSAADSTAFSSADFDQTYNFLRIVNTTNDKAAGIYFGIGTNGEAAITAAETSDGETALVFGTRGGGTRSERARLDHAGRLLVGTSTGSDNIMLHVVKSGTVNTRVESSSFANTNVCSHSAFAGNRLAEIGLYKHSGITNAGAFIRLDEEDGTISFLWVDNSGNLRIGSDVNFVGTTSGTVVGTQTSDERIKNILGPVEYGLDTIKQIEPIRYALKAEPDTEKLGFIAQQVQPLIPQSVFDTNEHIEGEPEDAPTKLGMEYVALIPVLVNAIKELSAEVDALKAQLS